MIPGATFGTRTDGRSSNRGTETSSKTAQQWTTEDVTWGRGTRAGGEYGEDGSGSGPCQCALARLSGTRQAAFALIILC